MGFKGLSAKETGYRGEKFRGGFTVTVECSEFRRHT